MDDLADIDLGRAVVAQRKLKELRDSLGLTRSVMAEFLHTSVLTYTSWEKRPKIAMWSASAGKIGRFYRAATVELELLNEDKVPIKKLAPLHVAASQLGVPQELLFQWYRDGKFQAFDLGILGLWLRRDTIKDIGH